MGSGAARCARAFSFKWHVHLCGLSNCVPRVSLQRGEGNRCLFNKGKNCCFCSGIEIGSLEAVVFFFLFTFSFPGSVLA